MSTQKRTVRRGAIRPRVKVWIEADGEHVFCSGMCRILQAVEQTGSIKAAAADVGLSYRHVWARIKESEASLGLHLVESQVGGTGDRRSTLSPVGMAILQSFVRLREQLNTASDQCATALKAELTGLTSPRRRDRSAVTVRR